VRRAALVALTLGVLALAPASASGADCEGPAGNPEPGSLAWQQREADNVYCGGQRFLDTSANPAFLAAQAENLARTGQEDLEDPFRDPWRGEDRRFRYREISFANASGERLAGLLFRPCDASCHDRPAGLGTYAPRYPGVVIVHGGGATQEMYLWAAEGLAEAGYMVLTFQIPTADNTGGDTHYENSKAALDYFLSTPNAPAAGGDVNPAWAELDGNHVGLAGHSAGGVAVSRLGQEDRRISAIVSWDRAQSSPMPDDLVLRAPALFFVADFNCQRVPVCLPEPYATPPDPDGPGNKGTDYARVSAAGIESMKIALRAATHLDFTQFAPGVGSRYGASVAFYYTLAWFDRHLKGSTPGNRSLARDALNRLTTSTFDGSADVHNISGGTWDPVSLGNVPARVASRRVADRLSFHFRSAYFLDRGRLRCEDMRAGCTGAAD
jgi:dienelactone hydrolase